MGMLFALGICGKARSNPKLFSLPLLRPKERLRRNEKSLNLRKKSSVMRERSQKRREKLFEQWAEYYFLSPTFRENRSSPSVFGIKEFFFRGKEGEFHQYSSFSGDSGGVVFSPSLSFRQVEDGKATPK